MLFRSYGVLVKLSTIVVANTYYDINTIKVFKNGVNISTNASSDSDRLYINISPALPGDILTLSIFYSQIKNIWGVLMDTVIDYPIVNNMSV